MSAPTDHTKQADFIRLWNTADSLDELSVRLNRSVTALKQRAARLSAHYTLRSFPGARRPPLPARPARTPNSSSWRSTSSTAAC